MTGIYRIAGKVIEVRSIYSRVHEYCRDYRFDGTPDLTVAVSQEDIGYERERERAAALLEGRQPYIPAEDSLEELAVYRKIAEGMLEYDTFLFHGSCVAVNGEGYLFTASSGTGKSTHTALWRKLLGDRAVMVNDDKPLIRADGSGVTVYGTPYNGKHRLGADIAVPLKAVCLLERAPENTIVPVTRDEAYVRLVQQTYRPAEPVLMMKTMMLIDRLADGVKLYRLGCNMDIEAAAVAYEGMK